MLNKLWVTLRFRMNNLRSIHKGKIRKKFQLLIHKFFTGIPRVCPQISAD